MHDSISVQNLSSHGFACMSSQDMSRVIKEHLALRDLRQTRVSEGTQYPCNSDRLRSSIVWSGEFRLCHAAMTLRTDHIWEKPLARQIEQGLDLSHQKPQILYELGTRCLQSWALSQEPLGEKSRPPEQAGKCDSHTRWLRMPEFTRLCTH
jgi:hypothetical protein